MTRLVMQTNKLLNVLFLSLAVSEIDSSTPPKPIISAPPMPVILGTKLELKCSAQYKTYQWESRQDGLYWDKETSRRHKSKHQLKWDGGGTNTSTNTLIIDKIECEDEADFECTFVARRKLGYGFQKQRVRTTFSVEQKPEIPSILKFEPRKIVVDTKVTFKCKAVVGKPAHTLEMFLHKTDGTGDKIPLHVSEPDRIIRPDTWFKCAKHETITSWYLFDERHYDHSVTCQIKDDYRYNRTEDLRFINPNSPRATATGPAPTGSTSKSQEADNKGTPVVPIILGGIGGVVLVVILIALTVLYIKNKNKQMELFNVAAEEPQRSPSYVVGGSRIFAVEDDAIMQPRISLANLASAPARRPSQIEYDESEMTSRMSRRSSRSSRSRRRHDHDENTDTDGGTTRRKSRRSKRRSRR